MGTSDTLAALLVLKLASYGYVKILTILKVNSEHHNDLFSVDNMEKISHSCIFMIPTTYNVYM